MTFPTTIPLSSSVPLDEPTPLSPLASHSQNVKHLFEGQRRGQELDSTKI